MATSFHGNLLRVLDLLEIEHRLRRLRQSNHLFSLDSFFFLPLSLSFLLRLFVNGYWPSSERIFIPLSLSVCGKRK